ncbi:Transcriptional regulator, TetR family [Actinomycetales bacterium JB111]|nr:Transcriptional regulator, TetR family [Actinomycetales bacterium JB111]
MSPTREELKQATHRRVLEAASRLFRRRGFAGTAVRDIAEAAQVSVGTVMTVGDKDTLLVRVLDDQVEAVHLDRTERETTTLRVEAASCADRLVPIVRPFVDLFTDDPELARTYAAILVSGSHSSRLFTTLAAHLVDEFGRELAASGCTPPANLGPRAQALYAAYVGTMISAAVQGLDDLQELSEQLRTTFKAICACPEE